MKTLAITHGRDDGPGIFREEIERCGGELEQWRIWEGGAPLLQPVAYDAVMVFGGNMSAYEEDDHPWLRDEDAILRELVDCRVPTLGICLGAQLLAKATSARVYEAPAAEVGFTACALTQAGLVDPVVGVLPPRFLAFNWHKDTWDVPPGAVELACTDSCTQAFRLGACAWGVQFHPEVDRAITDAALRESPITPRDTLVLAAQLDEHLDAWQALGRRLCRAFVGMVCDLTARGCSAPRQAGLTERN